MTAQKKKDSDDEGGESDGAAKSESEEEEGFADDYVRYENDDDDEGLGGMDDDDDDGGLNLFERLTPKNQRTSTVPLESCTEVSKSSARMYRALHRRRGGLEDASQPRQRLLKAFVLHNGAAKRLDGSVLRVFTEILECSPDSEFRNDGVVCDGMLRSECGDEAEGTARSALLNNRTMGQSLSAVAFTISLSSCSVSNASAMGRTVADSNRRAASELSTMNTIPSTLQQ